MPLWGNDDSNTSVRPGETLVIASVEYRIASVADNGTSLNLERTFAPSTTLTSAGDGNLPEATLNVTSTAGFPSAGSVAVIISGNPVVVNYTGITATSFTGCTGGTGALVIGQVVRFNSATGVTVTANEQPDYIPTADLPLVFGISTGEAQNATNRAKGIVTPGWVRYETYSNAGGITRNRSEVLVAGKFIAGDADGGTFPG
jgi:hypothetical protein